MIYQVTFRPRAEKDMDQLPLKERNRIINKLDLLSHDLKGDVKRMSRNTSEYRLRVGNYRILFEIKEEMIIIYHIKHRKDSY